MARCGCRRERAGEGLAIAAAYTPHLRLGLVPERVVDGLLERHRLPLGPGLGERRLLPRSLPNSWSHPGWQGTEGPPDPARAGGYR